MQQDLYGGFPKLGVSFLGGPYNKDYSILWFISGSAYLGKLPYDPRFTYSSPSFLTSHQYLNVQARPPIFLETEAGRAAWHVIPIISDKLGIPKISGTFLDKAYSIWVSVWGSPCP